MLLLGVLEMYSITFSNNHTENKGMNQQSKHSEDTVNTVAFVLSCSWLVPCKLLQNIESSSLCKNCA